MCPQLKNVNVNVPLHQIAGIDGDGCKYRFAGNRGFKGCASAAGSAQKSARTFFGECDQSRGDEQKFMEVKNIIVLRYCWDSMWQSRFFCTILRETCQKPERWQTAHDKTGFQNHGLGLRNIEVCAEKYYGKTEVTVREDEFELAVMLQERIE